MPESPPAAAADFLKELNTEQQRAVLRTDGPLLILAGAGSGKTRVIASRIAYLIAAGLASSDQVLAVTFTNKAAREMRDRVERLLRVPCDRLWISTFHALCARLLRREAPRIGLSRDFVIYDTADQLAAVKQALKELDIDDRLVQPRMALSRISQAKNRMEGPEDVPAEAWDVRGTHIPRIFERYVGLLREAGALDFDDLLLRAVDLFEGSTGARERYAERFRFVMVDEYQDTNRPQYLLVSRLAEAHRRLCVVGDPDQSIYRWRGADLRNILDFERDFPEAEVVRLERNYRSTQLILDAASAVIGQNRNRKEKRLWTERTGGRRLLYYRAVDELEEADFITRAARDALSADEGSPIAILYRTNAQSRVLEDALRREGLEYRIVGGVRFYERKEIKDALAYLKLIINPHDDVSMRRVINVPPRGIGKGVMEALQQIEPSAVDTDLPPLLAASGQAPAIPGSLWSTLSIAVERRMLPPRATSALAAFRTLLLRLQEIATQETVSATLGSVLEQTGYVDDLRDDRSAEAEARIENLMELVSASREAEQRGQDGDALTLVTFVDQLSLLSETDQEQGARDAQIWMMTLHAAKGLEFPIVVIAGLEEGLFPHSRVGEREEDVEEERRLYYVGLTRAQNRVVLTGAARRRVFGEYQASEPSRFMDEIPAELVEQLPSFAPSRVPAGSDAWGSSLGGRKQAGRRAGRPHAAPGFAYEDEDQSVADMRPGLRVRHPVFGVGTVIDVEEQLDDLKLTVRFSQVGVKKLLARYAKLELA